MMSGNDYCQEFEQALKDGPCEVSSSMTAMKSLKISMDRSKISLQSACWTARLDLYLILSSTLLPPLNTRMVFVGSVSGAAIRWKDAGQ